MAKNGIYFFVIALLVAELFKVLIYVQIRGLLVSMWPQNDVKSQKMQYL